MTIPVLTVPGLWNSGPQHWQTYWEAEHPEWRRVPQRDWDHPARDEWVATLDEAVRSFPTPPVLAAHSLGCGLVAHWAAAKLGGISGSGGIGVRGAFLVAPSDVEAPSYPPDARGFEPMPLARLPFPSLLVASTNDEYVTLERAAHFAEAWGSRLVVLGPAGHINGAAGYGPWPEGQKLFLDFCHECGA
jgi:predicted alpha/beta hydrolase family esterase